MGLIPFGRVLKIHGLSGEVKILPFSRGFDNLSRLERVFIQKKRDEKPCEFRIIRRRFHKEFAIVELQGIDSVDAAEELQGCLIMVETSDLLKLEEDEYYWFQLIGLKVYTNEGEYIGKVENLIDRAPQSLLVVKKKEKEFLIPMVDAIIKEINLEESKVVITPVRGLLD
jgi:16S rRNA processing protein RimM